MNTEQINKILKFSENFKIHVNTRAIEKAGDVAKFVRFQSVGYGEHHNTTAEFIAKADLEVLAKEIVAAGVIVMIVGEYHELYDDKGRYSTTRSIRDIRCLAYHHNLEKAAQQLIDYFESRSTGESVKALYASKKATTRYTSRSPSDSTCLNLCEDKKFMSEY